LVPPSEKHKCFPPLDISIEPPPPPLPFFFPPPPSAESCVLSSRPVIHFPLPCIRGMSTPFPLSPFSPLSSTPPPSSLMSFPLRGYPLFFFLLEIFFRISRIPSFFSFSHRLWGVPFLFFLFPPPLYTGIDTPFKGFYDEVIPPLPPVRKIIKEEFFFSLPPSPYPYCSNPYNLNYRSSGSLPPPKNDLMKISLIPFFSFRLLLSAKHSSCVGFSPFNIEDPPFLLPD